MYFPGLSMGHRICHTWPGQTGFFPGNLRLLSCILPACKVSWSDSQGAWNHDCSDLWLLCSLTLDNNSQGGPFSSRAPFQLSAWATFSGTLLLHESLYTVSAFLHSGGNFEQGLAINALFLLSWCRVKLLRTLTNNYSRLVCNIMCLLFSSQFTAHFLLLSVPFFLSQLCEKLTKITNMS